VIYLFFDRLALRFGRKGAEAASESAP
jgi:hypothetical protein